MRFLLPYISIFNIDIKPVVPWDIPGHFDDQKLSVPDWVSQDDALSTVSFTPEAESELERLVRYKKLAPLYTIESNSLDDAKQTPTHNRGLSIFTDKEVVEKIITKKINL